MAVARNDYFTAPHRAGAFSRGEKEGYHFRAGNDGGGGGISCCLLERTGTKRGITRYGEAL